MTELLKAQVLGLKETNAVIKQLPVELATKVYLKALQSGATFLKDELRRDAPYSLRTRAKFAKLVHTKYGSYMHLNHLRDMIKTRKILATSISFNIVVTVGKGFWGAFDEYGTYKQPSHPFFRPTFDRTKVQILEMVAKQLGTGVEQAAQRLTGPLNKSGLLRK